LPAHAKPAPVNGWYGLGVFQDRMRLEFRVSSAVALFTNSFGDFCMRFTLKATAAVAAALVAGTVSAQDMVVKLGHVGPTSGAIAHLGKDNENGARMAIEELNAKGVKIGGKTVKFELVAEDDAGDPKQGTAAAQKLVDSKVAGVIGHLNSGTSIPASKIYSDAGIPQISPSATNPKFTRQGYKTTFRVVADDVHLGGTLGKYAVQKLKGKSIAVIDDRTAYGQGVADEFEKAVKAAGGKLSGTRQFTNDKATDFSAILTAVKGKKPDVVFFGGMDAVAGPMMRQMKQLGINAKFMGGDGICSSELPKLAAGSMADGQVVCAEAGGVEGAAKKGMDDFNAAFKKKFNADVQVYAPYVYDSVNVMVAAMVKADSVDPKVYLPVLAKTDGFKGVTGTISFDNKGDVKNGALTLYTYKDGKRDAIGVVR
jgi:branched-chain amino acid transport system substrate-binding protein